MDAVAKLFLDRQINGRAFVGRLLQIGVTSVAAARPADSLYAQAMPSDDVGESRVFEGLTGGELMAEFLREWKVPYVFRTRRLRGGRIP